MQAQVQCPTCSTLNPTGKVFCISCGNALMGAPAAQPGSAQQSSKALVAPPLSQPQQQQPALAPYQPTQSYPPPAPSQYPPTYTQPQQAMQPYTPTQLTPYQQPASPYPLSQPLNPQYQDPYTPAAGNTSPNYNVQQTYVVVNTPPTQPYVQPYVRPQGRGGPILWLLLLLATVVGWAIAIPLGAALFDAVAKPLYTTLLTNTVSNGATIFTNFLLIAAIFSAVIGITIGLITGLAQWIVLAVRGYTIGTWTLASIVGWALGIFIALAALLFLLITPAGSPTPFAASLSNNTPLISTLYIAAIFGAIVGLVVGCAQWVALSGPSNKAGLWVLTSPIAGVIIACALVWILTGQLTQGGITLPTFQGNLLLIGAMYGAIIGAIEGTTRGAILAAIL